MMRLGWDYSVWWDQRGGDDTLCQRERGERFGHADASTLWLYCCCNNLDLHTFAAEQRVTVLRDRLREWDCGDEQQEHGGALQGGGKAPRGAKYIYKRHDCIASI